MIVEAFKIIILAIIDVFKCKIGLRSKKFLRLIISFWLFLLGKTKIKENKS